MHLARAFVLAVLSIALLGACGGNGTAEQATEAETSADTVEPGTTTDAVDDTTTETGPPPITADEKQWAEQIERLANRMSRQTTRVRVYTNAAMTRLAKLYATCLPTLRQAGSPGRMQPAARIALRACRKFQRSADGMRSAVALDAAGIDSQEEADRYSALISRALEAQGNGINTLEQARARAEQISASLPPE